MTTKPLTLRQLDALYRNLGALASEDHPELDRQTRDELGHVRHAIDRIIAKRELRA